jgi:hypothetical protein
MTCLNMLLKDSQASMSLTLTEYIMATRVISGLSLHALVFASANKHTGADIIVAHKLYKKTTVSSAGYIFIICVCKVPKNHI